MSESVHCKLHTVAEAIGAPSISPSTLTVEIAFAVLVQEHVDDDPF